MRGHAAKAREEARRRQAAAEARAKAEAEAAAEERRLAACEYLFIPPCMVFQNRRNTGTCKHIPVCGRGHIPLESGPHLYGMVGHAGLHGCVGGRGGADNLPGLV